MDFIPASTSSIDAGWLSEALGQSVRGFTVVDKHFGTTGRALLELQYSDSSRQTTKIFAKFPPLDQKQRLFVTASGMGRRESLFYQGLAREVPVRVPRPYYSACDPQGENYVMLLEDLASSGCELSLRRYSRKHVLAVLDSFAELHAAYWNSERFDTDLAWIRPPVQHASALDLLQQSLARHSAEMPLVFRRMGELYLAEADAIHALWNEGVPTLVHGDVHNNNLFLDGGKPGFLDWALVARAPAMRDVGYFLASVLGGNRWQEKDSLLSIYRSQLVENGVAAPSLRELNTQFAWHAAYVWVGAAVTLAMGDVWQPTEFVTRSLARLHTTLERLGSVDLLRQAVSR